MTTHPFFQVDAFADRPLHGNPCAVVLDADDLDDATMLAVAREMNLSETAFVRRSATADVGVRYFTPAEEIPLAGHPTVATVWALLEAGRLPLAGGRGRYSLELRDGPITVDVEAAVGCPPRIVMTQRRPTFHAEHDAAPVLAAFGLAPGDLLPGATVQTVSTGTRMLMVPLRDHDALRRARLDPPAYEAIRARGDFFGSHLFALGGATPGGRTFARHLSPPPDVPEDPFTGSATGCMAAYLWRHGLIDAPRFVAEQGHWMGRPGEATVEVEGSRDAITSVRVGGSAVTVVRGTLSL
ncbi:MAG: PhzF family phenazine biosynthesis protein [Gemmatimonadaceae bacterium]